MEKEIDFLKAKRKELYKFQRVIRMLNVASLVVLVLYCLIVAATIFLIFEFKGENQKLNSQINIKKAKISELKEVESLHYVLKQRLSGLTKYFSEKRNPSALVFSFFQSSITSGITLKKMEISSLGEINLNGQATDVLTLANFLDSLGTEEALNLFSKISINSLTKQKDGSYAFSLLMKVNEKS